ncbi:MAG: COX15/CtaA family protein [Flavobacteriales bacterium]
MRNLLDAWFKRLVVINLVLVFIVVIAGSIVRVTESGMGCPDWPKCFGAYIPPTSEDQVTWHEGEDFFEGQMIIHEEKLYNAKKDLTASTSFNPAEWEEFTKHGYATYNPVHTWIEFINRLATVALGFPVMALFALSFFYWKDRRARVYLSFAVVFLVGFQAWLGKLVVDSNLKGQTITLHMIGVFAIIGVLLILLAKARRTHGETTFPDKLFKRLSSISLYITVIMVVLGTQVREQIDQIAKTTTDRMLWIDQVDWMFITHRSLIYVIVTINGYLLYQAIKNNWYKTRWIMIAGIIIAEAVVGIILAHYGFPKAAQPLHLLLSTMLFALQFDLLIQLRAPKAIGCDS